MIEQSMKAQEDSRPALCWTFLSAGARLSLLLGYHRRDVLESDPPAVAESKRRVFWMLYMTDKILSLNLGRVSNFSDHDIDTPMFTISEIPEHRPWDDMFARCVLLSQIIGRIYDEVYSAKARLKSPEMKVRMVEELASSLYHWYHEFKKVSTTSCIISFGSNCVEQRLIQARLLVKKIYL